MRSLHTHLLKGPGPSLLSPGLPWPGRLPGAPAGPWIRWESPGCQFRPPALSEDAPSSRQSPTPRALQGGGGEAAHQTPLHPRVAARTAAGSRLPGSTGPTKWPAAESLQRPCPRPPAQWPQPPPPPGASAALSPAARRSFSTTDRSSFMVPDPAEAARRQSLCRRRLRGAGTRAGPGGAQGIRPGCVCRRPPGASVAGTCAEPAAAGCLLARSVRPPGPLASLSGRPAARRPQIPR